MMKLEIRKARHRDLPAVLQLLSEAEDQTPMSPPDAIRVYRKMWHYRNYSWYLAFHGGRLAGMFSLLIFPTLLLGGGCEGIVHVVVSGEQQGQGIGARMMVKAIRLCADAGCSRLMLAASIGEEARDLCLGLAPGRAAQSHLEVRHPGTSMTVAMPHSLGIPQ